MCSGTHSIEHSEPLPTADRRNPNRFLGSDCQSTNFSAHSKDYLIINKVRVCKCCGASYQTDVNILRRTSCVVSSTEMWNFRPLQMGWAKHSSQLCTTSSETIPHPAAANRIMAANQLTDKAYRKCLSHLPPLKRTFYSTIGYITTPKPHYGGS